MMGLFGRRKQPEQRLALQLPEGGFDHPFRDSTDRLARWRGKEHPRTVSVGFLQDRREISMPSHQIIELRMCALSSLIRERSNWWEEMKDEALVEEWRRDILQQQERSNEARSRRLTPAMVKSSYPRTTPPSLL